VDATTGEFVPQPMSVEDIGAVLAQRDRPKVTDNRLRTILNAHRDAFARVDEQSRCGRHAALWLAIAVG
jgi:hypothetical protein